MPSSRTVSPAGQKIRELRQLRGLTQLMVADEIGCLQSTISTIESGKGTKRMTLIAIAYVLNRGVAEDEMVSVDDLILQPAEAPAKPPPLAQVA